MKRTVPLLITAIVGFVLVCSAFIPAAETWGEKALIWFDLLAGIAFILGGGNLVGAQLKKISNRRPGWGYAAVTLGAFLITLGVGVLKVGVMPSPNQEFYGQSFATLSVDQLPESTIQVALSKEEANEALPASVRRQVTASASELRLRGWLSGSQLDDLMDAHPTLEWKCAIQRLNESAQPPGAFRGRLMYHAYHQALGFIGTMTASEQVELKQLAGRSQEFGRAVDELATLSRRDTTITIPSLPRGLELPAAVRERTTIANGLLTFKGPLSSKDRTALAEESLIARAAFPMSAADRADLEARLTAAGPLTAKQLAEIDPIVSKNWSDNLISVIDTAGLTKDGVKTACQLIADRNAGVVELDPRTPAPPAVQLNAEQKALISRFAVDPAPDWTRLVSQLKQAGPFTEAQEAAVKSFRLMLTTIGRRDRQLFDILISQGPLTPAQRALLLDDYHTELAWKSAVSQLFAESHRVKYPWSGTFNQQGSALWWLFEYVYQPIQSMMFALLAFYVASAAFRAFRAKNLEAILLLTTAFVVLLGRTYDGVRLTDWLPKSSPWRLENLAVDIMKVFNTAGNRAIMIGIALGIASTSLKILLGIDRSHTGGKD